VNRDKTYFLGVLAVAILAGALIGLKATSSPSAGSEPARVGVRPAVSAQQAPAARPGPPRILPGDAKVQLKPGQPGYDPAHLARFVGIEALFQQEPRDESWAGSVERAIPGLAGRDTERILRGFRVTSVECRTTVCRLTWDVLPEMAERAKGVVRFLVPGSTGGLRGTPPVYYFALAGAANPWYRGLRPGDPGGTLAALKTARQELLRRLRTGDDHFLVPAGIPPDAWPKE
jgi:hypothetical protein